MNKAYYKHLSSKYFDATLTERQEDAGRVPCIVVPDTLRAVQETAR